MKRISIFSLTVFFALLMITSCTKEEDNDDNTNKTTIIPKRFSVAIPDAISSQDLQKSSKNGPLQGNQIYENLRTFINVGEFSATAVTSIISAISLYGINSAMTYTYTSSEDGRAKNIEVTEDVTYGADTWEFDLVITDQDGGQAMQIMWNQNPIKGIAVLNPYNINRNTEAIYENVMYKVEYSEAEDMGYEKHMIVSISDYPVSINYSIDNLKMFVGKTGNTIDIYGNSNHPIAVLIDTTKTTGLNWAFVARCLEDDDIAVAKVALSPCAQQYTTNLFGTYSVYSVLNSELHWKYDPLVANGTITSDSLQSIFNYYLQNTAAPAYFNDNGFISCNPNVPSSPATFSTLNYTGLHPYIPKEVDDLVVTFYSNSTK
jgi:hypothetical protein